MLNVGYSIQRNWDFGFHAIVRLVNTGGATRRWRSLSFSAAFEITSIRGARILARRGSVYTVEPLAWNALIYEDEAIEIGFLGRPGDAGLGIRIVAVHADTEAGAPGSGQRQPFKKSSARTAQSQRSAGTPKAQPRDQSGPGDSGRREENMPTEARGAAKRARPHVRVSRRKRTEAARTPAAVKPAVPETSSRARAGANSGTGSGANSEKISRAPSEAAAPQRTGTAAAAANHSSAYDTDTLLIAAGVSPVAAHRAEEMFDGAGSLLLELSGRSPDVRTGREPGSHKR